MPIAPIKLKVGVPIIKLSINTICAWAGKNKRTPNKGDTIIKGRPATSQWAIILPRTIAEKERWLNISCSREPSLKSFLNSLSKDKSVDNKAATQIIPGAIGARIFLLDEKY